MTSRTPRTRRRSASGGPDPWPWIGLAAMPCVLFLYGASALVAPWWAVALLVLLWVVLFVQCLRWWSAHPRWLPVVAAAAAVVWFVTLVGGAALLGWSP
jgi:hypothetical protein